MPSSPSQSHNLTQQLLDSDKENFRVATQSRFLELAGKGRLEKEVLQQWLGQDRLYAQAYIRFASLLLANITLPSAVDPGHTSERLADLIVDSLVNIRRELKFFGDVASRYDININVASGEESQGVELYRSLFYGVGGGVEAGSVSILEALVVLWGTEKCYLEAWRYTSSFSPSTPPFTSEEEREDLDGGALRKEFIPNWTSEEFVVFVEEIAALVDALWKEVGKEKEEGEMRERVVKLWGRVLEAERVFWPVIE